MKKFPLRQLATRFVAFAGVVAFSASLTALAQTTTPTTTDPLKKVTPPTVKAATAKPVAAKPAIPAKTASPAVKSTAPATTSTPAVGSNQVVQQGTNGCAGGGSGNSR